METEKKGERERERDIYIYGPKREVREGSG